MATDAQYRLAAIEQYCTDDIEIDEGAKVERGDDGAFVQAWVWVYHEETQSFPDQTIAQYTSVINGFEVMDET